MNQRADRELSGHTVKNGLNLTGFGTTSLTLLKF